MDYLVVFEDGKFDLLLFVLDLLWSRVVLLLSFLSATSQSEYKMKRGLLLYVVVREGASVFKLLPSKYQPLLVRWNAYNCGLSFVSR